MEESGEIREFLSSLIETFGTPRMGQAIADALAAEPGVLMVGTDPAEWWDTPKAGSRARSAGAQLRRMSLFPTGRPP